MMAKPDHVVRIVHMWRGSAKLRRHPIHGESLGGLGQQLGVTPHKATRRPLAAPCRALPPCCQLPWRGPRPAPLMTRHKAARRPVAAPYCGALRSSCGALRQAGSSSAKQCTDTTRSPTVSLCPMSGCSARSEWSRHQPPAAILHLPNLQASQWGPGYMPATSKPKKVRPTLGQVKRVNLPLVMLPELVVAATSWQAGSLCHTLS